MFNLCFRWISNARPRTLLGSGMGSLGLTVLDRTGRDYMEFKHKSVLLEETTKYLNIRPDGIYVDGTLGAAAMPMRYAGGFPAAAGSLGLTKTGMPLKQRQGNCQGLGAGYPLQGAISARCGRYWKGMGFAK